MGAGPPVGGREAVPKKSVNLGIVIFSDFLSKIQISGPAISLPPVGGENVRFDQLTGRYEIAKPLIFFMSPATSQESGGFLFLLPDSGWWEENKRHVRPWSNSLFLYHMWDHGRNVVSPSLLHHMAVTTKS